MTGAADAQVTLNRKDTGYRGIWYMNQPSHDEYVYKYSGGLGTYCAKHKPFAVYAKAADKTFFTWGGVAEAGSGRLLHMASFYDHADGTVPRPTIVMDKATSDAHDNPVISLDDDGHVWIFSTSHGRERPSFIHRSVKPYDIDRFERVSATRMQDGEPVPLDNFSYMQVWHVPKRGFAAFFSRYNDPAVRTICFMTSRDGREWSEWTRLAAIEQGHYQVSACTPQVAGSAFNVHPRGKGVNWRANLYYIETTDSGRTWHAADGTPVVVPITGRDPDASGCLVHDTHKEGLLAYLKDLRYDAASRPVILYLTSKGYACGPQNDPRTWMTARWTGRRWEIRPAMHSDNNYDMGSLIIEPDGLWRIIAPTEPGPQPWNTGGEMALWTSADEGKTWTKVRQMTAKSPRNHTYARAPVNAHPGFYALWADGHARRPSESALYFCDREGSVFVLPDPMDGDTAKPTRLPSPGD